MTGAWLVIVVALVLVAIWTFSKGRRTHGFVAVGLGAGMFTWYLATDTAPSWFTNTLPYIVVLLVLVFASQRLRMPAADGQPYRKGGT